MTLEFVLGLLFVCTPREIEDHRVDRAQDDVEELRGSVGSADGREECVLDHCIQRVNIDSHGKSTLVEDIPLNIPKYISDPCL